MLAFATEFPVVHTGDSTDFLQAVEKWILGSPHTQLSAVDLAPLAGTYDWHLTKGNETVEVLRVSTGSDDASAIRYVRRDGVLEWVTTVVFSRTGSDSWVGIRVSCESSHPAARLPPAKKPVVVRTLLQALGGESDGGLPVGSDPIRLSNADIGVARRLILGTAGCRLPVVYVSAPFQGGYVVDCDRLAAMLAGMAHVVVEPNRAFSLRLKLDVGSANVYGGTVGVYWPAGAGRRSFFIGEESDSPEDLARAIFEEIRLALTNRRSSDRCTLAYVQETASRQAMQALRASGSQEVDKYIETFDKEVQARTHRLEDAEREISRLRADLRNYETRFPPGTATILRSGSEQDLYPNEVAGIVRDAVSDALSRTASDSRRSHVLSSILKANPASDDVAASQREQLKQLLRGSRTVDARIRRGLEEMGFEVTEEGKHYKLRYQGDDRYTFTLPKSGGDHRGGLNAAGDIARLLF